MPDARAHEHHVVSVTSEPMNGTDAALWDIERDPALRTTVVAIMALDRAIDHDHLLGAVDVTSRHVVRLRQRVVQAPLGVGVPHWEVVDDLDVADHVRLVDVGPDGDLDTVAMEIATEAATVPFDRERPLWECVHVRSIDADRSSLVLKTHHSLTDGVGGVALLDSLLDRSPEGDEDPHASPEVRSAHPPRTTLDPMFAAETVMRTATAATADAAAAAVEAARHPTRSADAVLAGGRSAARMLAPSGAALSPLFGERGPGRRLGTYSVPLDELHDAAARHGCTVNDVFLAGVLGGVAEYHRERGEPAHEVRVTIPINIRRDDDAVGGNQWAPVRLRLPVDIDDPIERMLSVRAATRRSRREPALGFSHVLAGVIQQLPSALSSDVVRAMMRGVDLVVTNVPGLREPRYVAGARVVTLYPFAPTGGSACNIALMSHEDLACIGTMSDTSAVEDPEALHDHIVDGIDAVRRAAEAAPPTRNVEVARDLSPDDEGPQRLTALDTSFLRLEQPETPMHIAGLFLLEGDALRDPRGGLRIADIRKHVAARVSRAPRYGRRLAEIPFGQGRPVWIDDPDFDVAHHVRFTSVPAPGGLDQLLATCADLEMELLDRSRPLWELWFVDGLDDGRVGAFMKVHHALLDGISAVGFVASLFDLDPLSDPDVPIRRRLSGPPSGAKLVADAWAEQWRDPVRTAQRATRAAWAAPRALASRLGDVVTGTLDAVSPTSGAPESRLNQPVGRTRSLHWIDLPVEEILAIRAAHDASFNDVVLAELAGGLASWLAEHHEPLDELQAMCPVSVRDADGAEDGGNRVGAMVIPLPLDETDPVRRLATITERTRRAKERHDGPGLAGLLDAVDHFPAVVPDLVGATLRSVAAHQRFVNLVVTNVPGPRSPLWFLGARVDDFVPIVPLGPNTALNVAVLSYLDHVTVAIHADPERCPDLDHLVAAVDREHERLLTS